jgi:amino acid permease
MKDVIKDLFAKSDGVNRHKDRRRNKLRFQLTILSLGILLLTGIGIAIPSAGLAFLVMAGMAMVIAPLVILGMGD